MAHLRRRLLLSAILPVLLALLTQGAHAQRPARADAFARAEANAALANEAFVRSDRLMMDWLSLADPATGLLPHVLLTPIWLPRQRSRDCSAQATWHLVVGTRPCSTSIT